MHLRFEWNREKADCNIKKRGGSLGELQILNYPNLTACCHLR